MANVTVFNMEGNEVGTMELNDAVFGVEINEHLVHLAGNLLERKSEEEAKQKRIIKQGRLSH